jgi:hypothetical protein
MRFRIIWGCCCGDCPFAPLNLLHLGLSASPMLGSLAQDRLWLACPLEPIEIPPDRSQEACERS